MLIEHDGKRIDTEREIRERNGGPAAFYAVRLRSGAHIIEQQVCGQWIHVWRDDEGLLRDFENVPQKHERWFVCGKSGGYATEAEAVECAGLHGFYVVAKAEWES